MSAVARAAGVGVATLFRRFPTREDLISAVFAGTMDAFRGFAEVLIMTFPAAGHLDPESGWSILNQFAPLPAGQDALASTIAGITARGGRAVSGNPATPRGIGARGHITLTRLKGRNVTFRMIDPEYSTQHTESVGLMITAVTDDYGSHRPQAAPSSFSSHM
jgi:AcrR family transcriptional regulator